MLKGFGKLYCKTFTGSMLGAGANVFAVWAYCIANAAPPDGDVELNPAVLSTVLGMGSAAVRQTIGYLCAPDPHSRSKKLAGRRLVKISEYEYRLVNWLAHRGGVDDDARKTYFREKKREQRERDSVKRSVLDSPGQSTQAEAEAEAEAEVKVNSPPTPSLGETTAGETSSLRGAVNDTAKDGHGDDRNAWDAGVLGVVLANAPEAWRPELRRRTRTMTKSGPVQVLAAVLDVKGAQQQPKNLAEAMSFVMGRLKRRYAPSDTNYEAAKRKLRMVRTA